LAERWIIDGNNFHIEASINPSMRDDVYTILLVTDINGEQVPLASYSIVYKDGKWVDLPSYARGV
jgi:hypothetical protein